MAHAVQCYHYAGVSALHGPHRRSQGIGPASLPACIGHRPKISHQSIGPSKSAATCSEQRASARLDQQTSWKKGKRHKARYPCKHIMAHAVQCYHYAGVSALHGPHRRSQGIGPASLPACIGHRPKISPQSIGPSKSAATCSEQRASARLDQQTS